MRAFHSFYAVLDKSFKDIQELQGSEVIGHAHLKVTVQFLTNLIPDSYKKASLNTAFAYNLVI